MTRNPIVFNNGTLISNAKVEIGGTIYDVEPAQYEGTTPLSANNLNQLQTNLYDYVDGIIESGSNENGNYVKYADGTMIQYGLISVTSEITTSVGALYRMSSAVSQLFPEKFANTNITITMTSRTDNVPLCAITWFGTGGFTYQTYSYTSIGSGTRLFFWQAIGKWK